MREQRHEEDFSALHVQVFLTLAETLSYANAAEALGYSAPAIHHRIKRLESILGSRLFERHGRGLRLTGAGERLLPYAQDILDTTQQLLANARALSGRADKSVVVAAAPVTAAYSLDPWTSEFERATRNLVDVHAIDHKGIVREVSTGIADMGIGTSLDRFADLEAFTLVPWRQISYVLLRRTDAPPASNTIYAAGFFSSGVAHTPLVLLLSQLARRSDFRNRATVCPVQSPEAVKEACLGGEGWAFLRTDCVEPELEAGVLEPLDGFNPISSALWLIYSNRRPLSRPANDLVAYLTGEDSSPSLTRRA